jgi:uncharacterized paraquat-inducible protein A
MEDKSLNQMTEKIFKEQETKLLKKLRAQHACEKAIEEREEQKKLHYMHCPKCGAKMDTVMMEQIEVDKCPECLGIYFDNLELEQLLELEFTKRKSLFRKIFGLK